MPPLKLRRIDCSAPRASSQLTVLRSLFSHDAGDSMSSRDKKHSQAVFGEILTPTQAVQRICEEVREKGLKGVARFSESFDRFELTRSNARVSPEEIEETYQKADPHFVQTIREIRENILEFQSGILHTDAELRIQLHHELRLRYRPMPRVGIYIPAGTAPLPSTLLMTVCPALAAGVKQLVITMPPAGAANPDMLTVCRVLGLHENHEIYRIGGAQAIAAMAYGVPEIGLNPVNMIVGPGNLYVTLAKQYVQNLVAIDCAAGPSEVVVVADQSAPPHFIAADLLAQAEHALTSKVVMITWVESLMDDVQTAMEKQLSKLERADTIVASLEKNGAFVLVADEDAAIDLVNELAPEHLHLQTRNDESFAEQVEHAGAIFLGKYSPVALGDYAAGPSHVLPTGGASRFSSGLNANDFMKRTSVLSFTKNGLKDLAAEVIQLADREGLTAHSASVRIRIDELPTPAPKPKKTEKSKK